MEYLGWQVGISYQAPSPEGLSREYLLHLLDEMAAHGMNLLSLMMVSQAYHDSTHDGYAWPVRNERLRCYVDSNCRNARPEEEFVGRIIEEAGLRGIAVQLFLQGPWWTAGRIREAYPDAQPVVGANGREHEAFFCLDSPGAWQACIDEAIDLLSFYQHPNVKSYAVEMISFPDCRCRYTQEAFRRTLGREPTEAATGLLWGTPAEVWRVNRARAALARYVDAIREVRPEVEVWLHTQGLGNGHMPHIFAPSGVVTLLPLDHFLTTEAEAHQMLEFLAPNPCVVHLCGRVNKPLNYPLPPKTPRQLREKIGWYGRYAGHNLRGLMFFNESIVPGENKQAIYEAIRDLR